MKRVRERSPAALWTAALALSVLLVAAPAPAHADLIRGVKYLIGGIFAIPLQTLAGTFSGPPIIGTVGGLLGGTMNGLGMIARGTMDIAGSAVPLAMKAAPYFLFFL